MNNADFLILCFLIYPGCSQIAGLLCIDATRPPDGIKREET